MISASKLRNGTTFAVNGIAFRVVDYKHTHLSRGGGTIKVRVRDLSSGRQVNKTFKSGDMVQDIAVERRELQYLYSDGDEYFFMDPRSFEQVELAGRVVGEAKPYLREGENVLVLFWDDKPLDLDLPPKVVMEVVDCAPGEKGNSASNVYKDAVVGKGLKIRVPLFINTGDKVRVDTRSGDYVERA